MNYENYTKEDWSKLNGSDWSRLLREQPQFSEHCTEKYWSKLDGTDWSQLLREQPQLKKYRK